MLRKLGLVAMATSAVSALSVQDILKIPELAKLNERRQTSTSCTNVVTEVDVCTNANNVNENYLNICGTYNNRYSLDNYEFVTGDISISCVAGLLDFLCASGCPSCTDTGPCKSTCESYANACGFDATACADYATTDCTVGSATASGINYMAEVWGVALTPSGPSTVVEGPPGANPVYSAGGTLLTGGDRCLGCKTNQMCLDYNPLNSNQEQQPVKLDCQSLDGLTKHTLYQSTHKDEYISNHQLLCNCDQQVFVTHLEESYSVYYAPLDIETKDFGPNKLFSSSSGIFAQIDNMCNCNRVLIADVNPNDGSSYTLRSGKISDAGNSDATLTQIFNTASEYFGGIDHSSCRCDRAYWSGVVDGSNERVIHTVKFGETQESFFNEGSNIVTAIQFCPCDYIVWASVSKVNAGVFEVIVSEYGGADSSQYSIASVSNEALVSLDVLCDCDRVVWVSSSDNGHVLRVSSLMQEGSQTEFVSSGSDNLLAVVASCGCDRVFYATMPDDEFRGYTLSSYQLDDFRSANARATISSSSTDTFVGVFPFDCACDGNVFWSTVAENGNNVISRATVDGENPSAIVSLDGTIHTFVASCLCGYLFWVTDLEGDGIAVYQSDLEGSRISTIETSTSSSFAGWFEVGCDCSYFAYTTVSHDNFHTSVRIVQLNSEGTGTPATIYTDTDDVTFSGGKLDDVSDYFFFSEVENDTGETRMKRIPIEDGSGGTTETVANLPLVANLNVVVNFPGAGSTLAASTLTTTVAVVCVALLQLV